MNPVSVFIAWSIVMMWWPVAALRDMLAEMYLSADATEGCDMTHYGFLSDRYKNQRFAGSGANGCVILAHDSRAQDAEVAIKISKKAGKPNKHAGKVWKQECDRARSIHEKACAAGGEAKRLVENYIPTCLEAGDSNEAPYIVMHAAAGKGIDEKLREVREKGSAAVFAQMVGALAAMHGIGLSHNDLHGKNVVILDRKVEDQESPLVAFIDFGEVVSLENGVYSGGYKEDENLLAREAYKLAHCPKKAEYPFLKEEIEKGDRDKRISELFKCLKNKWNKATSDSKKSPDEQFFNKFREVIVEAWQNQNFPTLSGPKETKVLELYNTDFIQENQPALHQLFPSASAGICDSPNEAPQTTFGAAVDYDSLHTTFGLAPDGLVHGSTAPPEVVVKDDKQEHTLVDGSTTPPEVAMANGEWASNKDATERVTTKETTEQSTKQATTTANVPETTAASVGSKTPADIAMANGEWASNKDAIAMANGEWASNKDATEKVTTKETTEQSTEQATTTANVPQTTTNSGKRQMVCGTLLPLILLAPVVNGIAL